VLTGGIEVEYEDGCIAGNHVFLIHDEDLGNNDWLAVNQFTVIEDKRNRRADVVAFLNGTRDT
jgi:type I restriction enzyme R subunit